MLQSNKIMYELYDVVELKDGVIATIIEKPSLKNLRKETSCLKFQILMSLCDLELLMILNERFQTK